MAEIKTQANAASVDEFINGVEDPIKREDCKVLRKLFEDITGKPAVMWGSSIIGFDTYHYKGRSSEGEWMVTGFSPRKASLTLYFMDGYDNYQDLLAKIGKYKTSKSCLYVKRLSDIDMAVLRQLATKSVQNVRSGAVSL